MINRRAFLVGMFSVMAMGSTVVAAASILPESQHPFYQHIVSARNLIARRDSMAVENRRRGNAEYDMISADLDSLILEITDVYAVMPTTTEVRHWVFSLESNDIKMIENFDLSVLESCMAIRFAKELIKFYNMPIYSHNGGQVGGWKHFCDKYARVIINS